MTHAAEAGERTDGGCRWSALAGVAMMGAVAAVAVVVAADAGETSPPPALAAPLTFEAREVRSGAPTEYVSHGPGYHVSVTPGEIRLVLIPERPSSARRGMGVGTARSSGTIVRLRLLGADLLAALRAEPGAARMNHIVGDDPARWRPGVPAYRAVRYRAVYPGIDLVLYGAGRQLEWDLILMPHADTSSVRMAVEVSGAEREARRTARLGAGGDLVIDTDSGIVHVRRPHVYRDTTDGRRRLDARYVIDGDGSGTPVITLEVREDDAISAAAGALVDEALSRPMVVGPVTPPLQPGTISAASTWLALPPGIAGTFTILARVDPEGLARQRSGTAGAAGSRDVRAGASLVVTGLTAPSRFEAGDTIHLGDTTTNRGTARRPATETRYYLSRDDTLDAGDLLLGERAVPALGPSESSDDTIAVAVPASMPAGTYWLLVVAGAERIRGVGGRDGRRDVRSKLVEVWSAPAVRGADQGSGQTR